MNTLLAVVYIIWTLAFLTSASVDAYKLFRKHLPMLRFYKTYVAMLLKFHLRISRIKPVDWKWGIIWRATTVHYPNRWLFKEPTPDMIFKRMPGKLEVSYTHRQAGVQGQGDYIVRIPKGLKIV